MMAPSSHPNDIRYCVQAQGRMVSIILQPTSAREHKGKLLGCPPDVGDPSNSLRTSTHISIPKDFVSAQQAKLE
jgi:hypothetical protein